MNNKSIVNRILEERGGILELILIAFFLALGTGILGNYIYSNKKFNSNIIILLGVLLCIIPVVIIFIKKFKNLRYNVKYNGFFIYARKKNRLTHIRDYSFGNNLYSILESVFYENRALLQQWEKEPLYDNKPSENKELNNAGKLLVEAIEHYLLKLLSLHLNGYFKDSDKNKYLHEYSRNDVLNLLESNRIIDIISKPTEVREKFLDDEQKKDGYEIISIKDDGTRRVEKKQYAGATFDRFSLILPKKSKITRLDNKTIKIDTPKFYILFNIDYRGFSSVISPIFIKQYLKVNQKEDGIVCYNVDINIKIKIKFLSLFTLNRWEYHKWIDSFLNKLDENVSKEKFFNKIDWDKIEALLYTLFNNKQIQPPQQNIKEEVAISQEDNNS